jgi:hypothetical protein
VLFDELLTMNERMSLYRRAVGPAVAELARLEEEELAGLLEVLVELGLLPRPAPGVERFVDDAFLGALRAAFEQPPEALRDAAGRAYERMFGRAAPSLADEILRDPIVPPVERRVRRRDAWAAARTCLAWAACKASPPTTRPRRRAARSPRSSAA